MKDSTPPRFRSATRLCVVVAGVVLGTVFYATDTAAQPAAPPECPSGAPCYPTPGPNAPVAEAPASDLWVAPPESAPESVPEHSPLPPVAPTPTPAPPDSVSFRPTLDEHGSERGADPDRIAEAHADRVMLMPTAYTHPEGTWYFSSLEIVVLQIGYAFDDRTQVTLSGVPPLFEGALFPFDLSVKHVFVRDAHVRFGALGAVSGLFGLEEGNFLVGRLGGVVSLCTTPQCDTSFNMASNVVLAGPAAMSLNSFGAILGLADWAAVLLEVDMSVPFGGQLGEANAALLNTGFRFKGVSWGLDLGTLNRLDDGKGAIPYLSVSYRSLP